MDWDAGGMMQDRTDNEPVPERYAATGPPGQMLPADADIAAGRTRTFGTIDELIAELDE